MNSESCSNELPAGRCSQRQLEFGHFEDGFQGAARSLARAIGEEESKNQRAQRKAKQLGGMTHHVNGGMPGRQARGRAQGSIGVSPVSRNEGCISANGSAAKFALQAFDHRPARESGTQAGRLCHLGLGHVPPLRPVGESSRLEISKLQCRHFVPGYYHAVPLGQNTFSPPRLCLS